MTPAGVVSRRAPLSARGDDLYETPPCAVEALLGVEDVPPTVWECACGPGSIARALRASGRTVYATDLVDYDSPDQDQVRIDFLLESAVPVGVGAIITNPPYKLATEFVEHGLRLCPKVVMLLRLAFLEGKRRSGIIDGKLARVYPFIERLPMMHRDGWTGPRATSSMAFAWFVFDSAHKGPAELTRISARRP